jgi:hypothetical protein
MPHCIGNRLARHIGGQKGIQRLPHMTKQNIVDEGDGRCGALDVKHHLEKSAQVIGTYTCGHRLRTPGTGVGVRGGLVVYVYKK